MEAHSYLAYSPRGAGLASALFYLAADDNVYGWYTGACSYAFPAAYFTLEDFYSTRATLFYRSLEDDVYGPWVVDYTPITTEARCPVPQPLCHELQRLQGAFVQEWLFFDDDEKAAEAYRKLGLPVQGTNVRADQLHRLDQRQPTWVYAAPGIDLNVVAYLKRSWPLDDKDA